MMNTDDPKPTRWARLTSWLWNRSKLVRWLSYRKRLLFDKPIVREDIVIYAHEFGSDEHGNGKHPSTAFRTMQHAMKSIPQRIEPGKHYTLDVTGLHVEQLPDGYTIPAIAEEDAEDAEEREKERLEEEAKARAFLDRVWEGDK